MDVGLGFNLYAGRKFGRGEPVDARIKLVWGSATMLWNGDALAWDDVDIMIF